MKVGFTGTRQGMTIEQWKTFERLLLEQEVTEWHDGDCVGADHQAHQSVEKFIRTVAGFHPRLIGHPCNLEKYRAFNNFDRLNEPIAPLQRNRRMVNLVDLMFATPKEYDEVMRGSGTWATIRYANLKGRRLIIIWPNGTEYEDKGVLDAS